jgi:hypothetical protein
LSSKRTSTVAASAVKATPAKSHTLPPQPPLNRTGGASASAGALPAVPESHGDDIENEVPDLCSYSSSNVASTVSRDSEGTSKTSLTQIRERPLSTDSHTVVRVPLA